MQKVTGLYTRINYYKMINFNLVILIISNTNLETLIFKEKYNRIKKILKTMKDLLFNSKI